MTTGSSSSSMTLQQAAFRIFGTIFCSARTGNKRGFLNEARSGHVLLFLGFWNSTEQGHEPFRHRILVSQIARQKSEVKTHRRRKAFIYPHVAQTTVRNVMSVLPYCTYAMLVGLRTLRVTARDTSVRYQFSYGMQDYRYLGEVCELTRVNSKELRGSWR